MHIFVRKICKITHNRSSEPRRKENKDGGTSRRPKGCQSRSSRSSINRPLKVLFRFVFFLSFYSFIFNFFVVLVVYPLYDCVNYYNGARTRASSYFLSVPSYRHRKSYRTPESKSSHLTRVRTRV